MLRDVFCLGVVAYIGNVTSYCADGFFICVAKGCEFCFIGGVGEEYFADFYWKGFRDVEEVIHW